MSVIALKRKKKAAFVFEIMTWQHEILLSEGSFGFVVIARLLDWPHCSLKEEMIPTALS